MSMYEIESLVEDSINVLGASTNETLDKKNIIWNLYNNIQGKFDCGYTNFRVMEILLKNNYTNTITIEEHPEYANNKVYFEDLKNNDSGFIKKHPTLSWDRETNPEVCFYFKDENKIFYDHGSILEEQLLKGDTSAPKNIDAFELALIIMREAEKLNKTYLIYEWYAFSLMYYDEFSKDRDFELLKSAYFIEMKNIFFRSKANLYLETEDDHSFTIMNQDEINKNASYFDKSYLTIWSWFTKKG